jgi:hypothetical protein
MQEKGGHEQLPRAWLSSSGYSLPPYPFVSSHCRWRLFTLLSIVVGAVGGNAGMTAGRAENLVKCTQRGLELFVKLQMPVVSCSVATMMLRDTVLNNLVFPRLKSVKILACAFNCQDSFHCSTSALYKPQQQVFNVRSRRPHQLAWRRVYTQHCVSALVPLCLRRTWPKNWTVWILNPFQ